jgi:hypothetical protein
LLLALANTIYGILDLLEGAFLLGGQWLLGGRGLVVRRGLLFRTAVVIAAPVGPIGTFDTLLRSELLFGLLLVGGKLRDAVKIITSFTIAHSLTLALATLNVINIPSRVVEPIIAASIVYVGFENMLRDNFSKRWMLTFAFGLIHGCGFASVLREMGVGADGTSVVTPLVCFNLGVEMGQLAFAGIMLPLIWKLKPAFPKRWIPVASVGLIIVGSYFLVQRVWM